MRPADRRFRRLGAECSPRWRRASRWDIESSIDRPAGPIFSFYAVRPTSARQNHVSSMSSHLDSVLSEFDPLQQSQQRAGRTTTSTTVFDGEASRFAELTGLDAATAAVQIKAARLKGMSFEEAVDRFYANNKAHVREGDQVDRARMEATRQRRETSESDAALARAIANEQAEKRGAGASLEEMVAKLQEMGFDQQLALRAARQSKTFDEAAEFCADRSGPARSSSKRRAGGEERFAKEGERRRAALDVAKVGKLYKLSRGSSMLGARWQARPFHLMQCALSYSSENSGKKKAIPVWDCYVVRQHEKVLGKEYVFAIYAGNRGAPKVETKPIALLASDDKTSAGEWLLAITLASGRVGHVLKVGHNELKCSLAVPYDQVEKDCSIADSESRKVLIARVSGRIKALGLKVDDEILTIDDQPPVDARAAKALLQRAQLPVELTIRRGGKSAPSPNLFRVNSDSAPLAPPPQGQVPVLDLLSLDVDDSPKKLRPNSSASTADSAVADQLDAASPDDAVDELSIAQAVSVVQAAFDHMDRGRNLQDPAAARAEFHAAIQSLLSVQPAYASDQSVRDAVADAFPGHHLANVYDDAVRHIQHMDHLLAQQQFHAENYRREPQVAPTQEPEPEPSSSGPEHHRATHAAVYAFQATEPWQLSIADGEPLQVIETLSDGWSDCVNANLQRGLVPSSYVAPY